MLRRTALVLVALLAACPRPIAPAAQRPAAPAVERSAPPAVELPSRARDTDARGFYAQPAGLGDDFPEESSGPDKIRRDFETARATGARYLRFAVGWDSAEPAPGKYDWRLWDQVFRTARETGVIPLPYVCYTPRWLNPDPKDYWRKPPQRPEALAQFMEAVSRRYAAPSWELWNEPDNDQYWLGSPEEFARLVRSGAEGVRRGDPRAKVVLGGMSKGRTPFLEQTLRETSGVIDVVNLHGYLETWDARRAEEYPRYIAEVADAVRTLAPRSDLWLAEFGYSDWLRPDGKPSERSYAVKPWEHSRAFQAVALLRAHALALGTGLLSLTTWYRVDDLPAAETVIGDENNKHLGLLDASGAHKPAFFAMALWNRLLSGPVRPIEAHAEGAVVRAFEKPSGERVVIAWLPSARKGETTPDDAVVSIQLARPAERVEVYDPATGEIAGERRLASVRLRADSVLVALAR
jgi:hypothetical protein